MFWTFALALTVFEILPFEIFDIEELGQGQRVQHSQLCHSMANVEIYKYHLLQFRISFHRFRDIDIWSLTLKRYVKVTQYNIRNDAIR